MDNEPDSAGKSDVLGDKLGAAGTEENRDDVPSTKDEAGSMVHPGNEAGAEKTEKVQSKLYHECCD